MAPQAGHDVLKKNDPVTKQAAAGVCNSSVKAAADKRRKATTELVWFAHIVNLFYF